MKKLIFVVTSILACISFSAHAEIWQCVDINNHEYLVGQNVPSDRCLRLLAKEKEEAEAKERAAEDQKSAAEALKRENEAKERAAEAKEKAKRQATLKKLEAAEKAEIENLKDGYQKAIQKSSVVCVGEKTCKKYFQLTQIFISKNSDMKLQVATDTVIETYNPTELFKIGMKGTKSPGKGDSERINLEVFCKSEKVTSVCMRKEIAIYEHFRPYIETSLRQ